MNIYPSFFRFCILIPLLAVGCVGESSVVPLEETSGSAVGFFYGIVHGLLFYKHLFEQLFGGGAALYDLYHSNLYDIGFVTGVGISSSILRLALSFPFTQQEEWNKTASRTFGTLLFFGTLSYFFTDSSNPHFIPASWPSDIDQNAGIFSGLWHAFISPWMSFVTIFGYDSSLMASQNASYVAPYAIVCFLLRGRKKKPKEKEEEEEENKPPPKDPETDFEHPIP
ncbi:MAG: hypothetical protein VX278_23625 [Myxococcota bacterium]|nr:hypothetical protein [Myxococcota bacterium]